MPSSPNKEVFINCPFDLAYRPMFEAIVFGVSDCGFAPRCALEIVDGGQTRIDKILEIIGACRFGIHDISRTQTGGRPRLPRFNMPFELGLFLGAKNYGKQTYGTKSCLILDSEPHRYQRFLSDIAGQDIQPHADDPRIAITKVRDWLQAASRPLPWAIPSGAIIDRRYAEFRKSLPSLCRRLRLAHKELTFHDYRWLIWDWLKQTSPKP